MREFFSKIALVAAFGLALAFALSCSVDGGGGGNNPKDPSSSTSAGGSGTKTETCEIKNIDFTRLGCEGEGEEIAYADYRCGINGFSDNSGTYNKMIYLNATYSIANNVLTLFDYFDYGNPILFNGNQDIIIGTWTRAKNKAESCKRRYHNLDDISDYDNQCDRNYDITKMVVTNTNITITRDVCYTDHFENGRTFEGWTVRVVDCNNLECSKGTKKVNINFNFNTEEEKFTYNGKTCSTQGTRPDYENACQTAVQRYSAMPVSDRDYCINKYYNSLADKIFPNCLEENLFPEGTLFLRGLYRSDDAEAGGGCDGEGCPPPPPSCE